MSILRRISRSFPVGLSILLLRVFIILIVGSSLLFSTISYAQEEVENKIPGDLNNIVWDAYTDGKSPNLKSMEDYYIQNELPWNIIVRPTTRELIYEIGDKYIGFSPSPFSPTSVSISDDMTTATFSGIFGKGQSIELISSRSGFKKLIKLDSLKDLGIKRGQEIVSYSFIIDTNIDFLLDTPITEPIEIAPNINIEVAQAWDSAGKSGYITNPDTDEEDWVEVEHKQVIDAYFHEVDGQLFLTKEIPVSWLNEAVFPVYADVDITYGTASEFYGDDTDFPKVAEIDTNKFVVVYVDHDDVTNPEKGVARVGTVVGTTITWGTAVEFSTDVTYDGIDVCKLDTDKFVVVWQDDDNADDLFSIVATVSTRTISFGSSQELYDGDSEHIACAQLGTDKFVISFNDETGGDNVVAIVCTVATTTVTAGTMATVDSNGESYAFTDVCKLDTDKFFVAYIADADGDKCMGCACTVSGTTITAGTPETIDADDCGGAAQNTTNVVCTQLDTDKVAVAYANVTEDKLQTAVCTVATTTITVGTKQDVIADADYVYCGICTIDATHYVVVGRDNPNSNYGNSFYSTVTGTNVSVGSAESFSAAYTTYPQIAHLGSGKVVVVYCDDADATDHGEAIIGDAPFAGAVAITNTQDTWNMGILVPDAVVYFSVDNTQDDDWSQIENTGDVAVDIEIQGTDIEGGDYDWTLANVAGVETYSLYANSESTPTVYDIEVKSSVYNDLYANLAAAGTYDWSMKFTAPSGFNAADTGTQKSATVTLVCSEH